MVLKVKRFSSHIRCIKCLLVFAFAFFFQCAEKGYAYTYLAGGKGLQRDANGLIFFYRSDEVPKVEGKEDFEGGIYKEYTDEEVYNEIADRVETLWNSVPGKSFTIEIVNDGSGRRDSTDGRNSITLFTPSDNKTGGDAGPVLDSSGKFIHDCDIRISRTLGPEEFGIVLAHEIGHCLGLGHEHKDLNAVMSYNRNKFKLTLDDAAGVASIYPAVGLDTNSDFQPCGTVSFGQFSEKKQKNAWNIQVFMLFLPLLILVFRMFKKFGHR